MCFLRRFAVFAESFPKYDISRNRRADIVGLSAPANWPGVLPAHVAALIISRRQLAPYSVLSGGRGGGERERERERLQMGCARYPLLRRQEASGGGTPSVINSPRIMSRSRSTPRSPRLHYVSLSLLLSPFRRPSQFSVPPVERELPRAESSSSSPPPPPRSWNFRESRGDGKIRGRWKIQQPPAPPPPPSSEHPWPTPHSENAWEALPGAPFIAGLAEGRRRARRAEEGNVGGGWGGRKSDCQYIPWPREFQTNFLGLLPITKSPKFFAVGSERNTSRGSFQAVAVPL